MVDAIDMVPSKIHLIESCYKRGLNIISSMGMGNKLDPTMIEIADIHKTEMCPLAKIIRREAKKRGIKKLPVVYSREKPRDTGITQEDGRTKRVNAVSYTHLRAHETSLHLVCRLLLEKKKKKKK